ncbi:hypothetical protein J6590_019149 [Homalodisca vitripennis]|nr:hypothetical protein J6590_019149 [Homalodisca vitripennis]
MLSYLLLVLGAFCCPSVFGDCDDDGKQRCMECETIDFSLNDAYCKQPLFVNFLPNTERHCLIDNICYTYFPLPDDPYTFNLYRAIVFCDGSTIIETTIVTELEIGRYRGGDPYCTFTSNVIGYAGCDTYVMYRCLLFGECTEDSQVVVYGLSPSCLPLGISCTQKVAQIVEDAGFPEIEFIALPMKLPNRCVTEQICVNNIEGNFFRALNLPLPEPQSREAAGVLAAVEDINDLRSQYEDYVKDIKRT